MCRHRNSLAYTNITNPRKDVDDAVEEYRALIRDLDEAGLRTQVRHGPGVASLLIFVRVPRALLGNMIYKSR